ncbi:Ig-like domain-containing protein, partial [Limnohabitans sp.]|uniref:Ig-like domain-containing protein n=1 Tax=Limnohabitans sp. TaxID=1907725 RepID=UPI0031FC2AE8
VVTVKWPDGTTSTTATLPNGNWSIESPTVQPVGEVQVVATDGNGNPSDPATVDYKDNTPPKKPTITAADTDSDGKIDASGTAEPESTITVTWPDGTTSTTTTKPDGTWSVESPSAQATGPVQVIATDLNGNPSTQAQTQYVDTLLPVATIDVDNITSDNLISAQEAGLETLPVTGTVAGEFTPGDVVSVIVNDKTFTGSVNAQGKFSVDVPTPDLLADSDTKLQVSVVPTDASDNSGQPATAVLDYATAVKPPENAALIVDLVAGDNIISLAEGAQSQSTLSGKVTGPFTEGDVVTVNLNDKAITGTLNAQGAFSIAVNMTDLKADDDHKVHVTALVKDTLTGLLQAVSNSQEYGVDPTGDQDTALAVNPITGDNLINAIEAASLNTFVTGAATGKFAAGDVVSVIVNNKTFTGSVNTQGQFSISVPTAQLLVDADTKLQAMLESMVTGKVTATAEQDYTVDTVKPAKPSVTATDSDGDGQINASGTAEPGSVVTVKWPDGTTSTTATLPNGSWSIESPTVQEEGTLQAVATDGNGNVSDPATAQYVDNTPPGIPTITATDSDSDGKINASGTAEPASTVTVTWPDGTTSTTLTLANGSWSVESPTVQEDGEVKATATDVNDNVSDPVTAQYEGDSQPFVIITLVTDSDTDGKINASGTADPASTVTVTWPDGTTSTTLTLANGSWSVESPTVQEEGPVKAVAKDLNDNVSDPVTAQYVDNTPPAPPTVSTTDSDSDGKINASGTAEPDSTITVKWPDGTTSTTTTNPDGTWSIESPTVQEEGTVEAVATDVNGNTGQPGTGEYVDNTPPGMPTITATDSDSDGKINASGTAEPASTVTVTWPDGTTSTTLTLANGSWSVESPTVQEEGTVKAVAKDINDNVSDPVTAQYVDSTPPKIDIESLTQNDDGTLTVSGISEAGATVVVKDKDGTLIGSTTVGTSGSWTVTSPGTVPEGDINATATDVNNQEATDTAVFTLSPAQEVEIDEPITQNLNGTIKVTGTGEKGANIEVTDVNGDVIGTTTVLENGTWSITSAGPVPEGTLTATSTDINSQTSTDTAPYVDNKPPLVSINEPITQ